MQELIRVHDNRDLARDRNSNAILNVNTQELNKYKKDREEKLKIRQVIEDQEQLKQDINDIKLLLQQLIGQQK